MAMTYEPIATTTLNSTTASISFTSISQSYTDLILAASVRGTTSTHLHAYVGNGSYDSGTNYSVTGMYARSTTNDYASERNSNYQGLRLSPFTYNVPSASSTFGTCVAHFQNYSNTTTYKTVLIRNASIGSNDYAGTEAAVSVWRNTNAINQIQIFPLNGSFVTGTIITLYGIKAA
jgi:hypothetical protein